MSETTMTPRERVKTALSNQKPDRLPVDFLATNEVWDRLIAEIQPSTEGIGGAAYYEVDREALLRHFEVDCRLFSYDMFCNPPDSALYDDADIEWWEVMSRSTPNRMWRQRRPSGDFYEIFGRHTRIVHHQTGAYEELASQPLGYVETIEDLKAYPWPDPEWWDFSPVPELLALWDSHQEYNIRYRLGSVFEVAWQLRGMEQFLVDMALTPEIPTYIMERLTDIYVEITRRALDAAGDRLDMVYFYDDVATQNSLMISQEMWGSLIRPYHIKIINLIKSYGLPVMYHSDGSMRILIPELIEMGIDVLNPVQTDAKGMEPGALKKDFGDQICFHGGVNITNILPHGSTEDVRNEVINLTETLGQGGGYVLASSHHIQPDTPNENVLAMYDMSLREY